VTWRGQLFQKVLPYSCSAAKSHPPYDPNKAPLGDAANLAYQRAQPYNPALGSRAQLKAAMDTATGTKCLGDQLREQAAREGRIGCDLPRATENPGSGKSLRGGPVASADREADKSRAETIARQRQAAKDALATLAASRKPRGRLRGRLGPPTRPPAPPKRPTKYPAQRWGKRFADCQCREIDAMEQQRRSEARAARRIADAKVRAATARAARRAAILADPVRAAKIARAEARRIAAKADAAARR
jgi:hypothetical protein